jgi:hypothetical protein
MNKREYLRSKGFEVGERGRMSQAMKNVLLEAETNGTKFDDVVTVREKEDDVWAFMPEEIKSSIPPQEKVREPRDLYGLTVAGDKVAFILCGQCSYHMIYCTCEGGVQAPSIVVSSTDPLVRIRRLANSTR